MEFERAEKRQIELSITPLIDIVFLLLIFFMLTSNFLLDEGLKIDLPSARTAEVESAKDLTIFLGEDGRIVFDGRTVTLEGLEAGLTAELQGNPNLTVIIRADRKVDLEKAVGVMDAVKASGAPKMMLATELEVDGREARGIP